MPSAFAKAFVKKAEKSFSEIKKSKHREGSSFGPADVPDGSYSAVVTFVTGLSKKDQTPWARAVACISTGPQEGKEPSKFFFCDGQPPTPADSDERPTAEQELFALLSWLLPDIQIDDISQIEDAIDLVNKRGPLCIVGIKNDKKRSDGSPVQYVNFNKVVKPATFTDATAVESSAQEDTTASSDGPEYVPAKGDMVFIDGDDSTEYEVVQVSQSKQTANVVDADGTKKNQIAWADLQPT